MIRETGLYAVIAEYKNQGPILLETESKGFSRDEAIKRMDLVTRQETCIRAAVVQLVYEVGNEALAPRPSEPEPPF